MSSYNQYVLKHTETLPSPCVVEFILQFIYIMCCCGASASLVLYINASQTEIYSRFL